MVLDCLRVAVDVFEVVVSGCWNFWGGCRWFIKQESGMYKKWEGNQFLEQEMLSLQWDMSTIQVEINMERNISNT